MSEYGAKRRVGAIKHKNQTKNKEPKFKTKEKEKSYTL
jgi:hypothetical protein